MWNRYVDRNLLILGVIILLALALRAYDLGRNPFVADEFIDMNAAYGYAQTGEWRAWDFNTDAPSLVNENTPRDERATVYKWQVAQVLSRFEPTEAAARSVSVFWGLVTTILVYLAAWRLTGKKTLALLATVLFAVSVSGIIYGRRLRMYAMFAPVYFALSLVAFLALERAYRGTVGILKTIQEKTTLHPVYTPLALGLFALALLTHQLAGTFVATVGIYLLTMGGRQYLVSQRFRNRYLSLVALGATAFVILFLVAPSVPRSFLAGLHFFDEHFSYFGHVFRDYQAPLLALMLAAFGTWFVGARLERPKEALFLTLSFAVPLLMAVFLWRRNVGPQYIFFIQPFLAILVASGAFALAKISAPLWTEKLRSRSLTIGLVLGALLLPNYGYFLEENNTYHETSSGDEANYRKVFGYVKKEFTPGNALVTRHVRNYYFAGLDATVYDLGDEIDRRRLSPEDLLGIMTHHTHGFLVFSDNDWSDYVSKEAKAYIIKNLTEVDDTAVRGPVYVYRW